MSAVAYIDTHCHLDEQAFQPDLADVVQRAQEAGVRHMMTIGISLPTSEAAVVLANQYSCVSAVIGIQPNYVSQAAATDWQSILELAGHPQVVGIGETGLDLYWDYAPLDLQIDYFRRHLQLARHIRKPFVVHCREAEADVLKVLEEDFCNGPLNGIMHSYCGDAAMAERCVDMGMHISFAGMVTFKKNDQLRQVASSVPLNRLLIETDAPYLAPHPKRGKRNEPALVVHTAQCLADVHGISVDALAAETTRNASRLFRLGLDG